MSSTSQILEYSKEIEENQRTVRKMVLDSYQDIKAGKGRDYKEFFGELEKKYSGAGI